MSTFRCDHLIPDLLTTSVATGTTAVSNGVPLHGMIAISIQVALKNGAAGMIFIDGTNQQTPSATNQLPPSQMPVYLTQSNLTLDANQQAVLTFSLVDQITSMHSLRVRFEPTAGGDIKVSFNGRRVQN